MKSSLLLIGLAVVAGRAQAQATDPATRAVIERLLERVDSLEKRLAELEKGGAVAKTTSAASPAAPAAAIHQSHDTAPVPTIVAKKRRNPRTSFREGARTRAGTPLRLP